MGLGKKCTSGSGDPDSPKAPMLYLSFMSNTPNAEGSIQAKAQSPFIKVPTNGADPADYRRDLHRAITRMKLLVFERRSVDLEEDDTYALFLLTGLQQSLAEQLPSLRDPKEGAANA
jgi:hypothetical protein